MTNQTIDIGPLRPLDARSVVLSTLLGTDPPRMPVARLVRAGEIFGLRPGTVRTALTRMVQRGELRVDEQRRYRLDGVLLDRQVRQSASVHASTLDWDGRWRVGVVTASTRDALDRRRLRGALTALRFAEQREGVWTRPDNLASGAPAAVAIADNQCYWYDAHPMGDDAELAAALWDLDEWATQATRLRRAMAALAGRLEAGDQPALADGFVLSAAVLRHLQADPLLPRELLPSTWPGASMRREYADFDAGYRESLAIWFRME